MVIENFLAEIIIDAFENYMYTMGLSEEQIDSIYIDKDTMEKLDDIGFLKKHGQELFDEEMLDAVYTYICDISYMDPDSLPYDIETIISYFANQYIIGNYGNNNSFIDYLNNNDLDDIVDRFMNEEEFALELLLPAYQIISDESLYYKQIAKIMKNNDGKLINKFNNINECYNINDLLRGIIVDLYNTYISYGCSDVEALTATWAYFTSDVDPKGVLDQICGDEYSKLNLKQHMLSLIFADLYEDGLNGSNINSDNYDDRLASFIPIFCVNFGFVSIPSDINIRNRILKQFILLQDEKQKLKENRIKTYEDGRYPILRKVNKACSLDDLHFLK